MLYRKRWRRILTDSSALAYQPLHVLSAYGQDERWERQETMLQIWFYQFSFCFRRFTAAVCWRCFFMFFFMIFDEEGHQPALLLEFGKSRWFGWCGTILKFWGLARAFCFSWLHRLRRRRRRMLRQFRWTRFSIRWTRTTKLLAFLYIIIRINGIKAISLDVASITEEDLLILIYSIYEALHAGYAPALLLQQISSYGILFLYAAFM